MRQSLAAVQRRSLAGFHQPGTIIEFTHRATSGIDLALVARCWWSGLPRLPSGHPVAGATLSAIFLMTEALLGAALVLLGHVAKNASTARAYSLTAHLLNTLTLLACLTLTAWWGMGKPAVRPRGRAATMAGVSLAFLMILGVSGAIAALGDTLFPARSLAAGLSQDLDPAANIFLRLRSFPPRDPPPARLPGCCITVSCAAQRRGSAVRAWLLAGFLGAQLWRAWLIFCRWRPSGCRSFNTCRRPTWCGFRWSCCAGHPEDRAPKVSGKTADPSG